MDVETNSMCMNVRCSTVKAVYDLVMNSSGGGYGDPLVVGNNAAANGAGSIAIGRNSNASGNVFATTLGAYAAASANYSIAIGHNANAITINAIAIGRNSIVNVADGIAIGTGTKSGDAAFAGGLSAAAGSVGVAIGWRANAANNNGGIDGIALGTDSNSQSFGIAIGRNAHTYYPYGIAIGFNSNSNDTYGIAIGHSACANSTSVAIGQSANAKYYYSVTIGTFSSANASSVAVGEGSMATGMYSTAIGGGATANANYSTALGYEACSINANSIQLGNSTKLSGLYCKVAITQQSDERDKADISEIANGAIQFLNNIRAVRYLANPRAAYHYEDEVNKETGEIVKNELLTDEGRELRSIYGLYGYDKEAHARGDKKGERVRVGVIAQEVQKALKAVYGDSSYGNLVNDNLFDFDPDTIPDDVESQLGVTYESFIPFLIKAIQELDSRLTAVETSLTPTTS